MNQDTIKTTQQIHVVDAMMGMGKTSASIQYMNEHAMDKKFLYITPYIDETERIQKSCPSMNFVTPSKSMSQYGFRKLEHLKHLAAAGANVAMTHALFSMCDSEAIRAICDADYTIIIDEVVDVFQPLMIKGSDVDIILDSGWLVGTGAGEDSEYTYYEQAADKQYQGGRYADLFTLARSRRLINVNDQKSGDRFYFWSMHKELFQMAKEVYVLTYLFEGSPMKAYMQINGITYDYMGIERRSDGTYHFSDSSGVPDYAGHISQKIHICENAKLNEIGNNKNALSKSWWEEGKKHRSNGHLDRMRKNLYTYFRLHSNSDSSSDRLWCTFSGFEGEIRGKGFYRNNIAVNSRATNQYKNCTALAYCANIFANPIMLNYFSQYGADIDKDLYALSTLVQWIWRSAIRDGKDVWVYIPSKRMRMLLKKWMNDVEKQYAAYHDMKNPEEVTVK